MTDLDNFATYETAPLLDLAETYQRAFNDMTPTVMPGGSEHGRGRSYAKWFQEHPSYTPAFANKMGEAITWAQEYPDVFEDMVFDLDDAISFLNGPHNIVDQSVYPNIAEYRKTKIKDSYLPTLMKSHVNEAGVANHNKWSVLRGVVQSARLLRLGETTQPADGNYYSFHKFVVTNEGMAAASLIDLYEIYITSLGLKPQSSVDSVLANALTEAIYLTGGEQSALFTALRDPKNKWIANYPGFSQEFKEIAIAKSARVIPVETTPIFKRDGFNGNTIISKETARLNKLGFTALFINVHGEHPAKRILEGTARTYFVTDGEGKFVLNGEEINVKKGDFIVLPEGSEYSYSGLMTLFEQNISPDNSFKDELI